MRNRALASCGNIMTPRCPSGDVGFAPPEVAAAMDAHGVVQPISAYVAAD
jgi:hypothetical protein